MNRIITMKKPSSWHGDMWREGAPCGNGTVGALIYGGIKREIILINHTKLWGGGKVMDIPDISEKLAEVRKHLDDKRPDLAANVLGSAAGEKGYSADGVYPRPLCDICIDHEMTASHKKYKRTINMEKAEVTVSWEENGVRYSRSTFVSRYDGFCYTRIRSENILNEKISLTVHDTETIGRGKIPEFTSVAEGSVCSYTSENSSAYKPADGTFGAVLKAYACGGKTETDGSILKISGTKEIVLVLSAFVGIRDEAEINRIRDSLPENPDYERALEAHCGLYTDVFNESSLSISDTDTSNDELLTDAFENGMSDELAEKMYEYGRYLFLCSTGSANTVGDYLPTHLVGLWNGTYQCFWAFHMFNINFEMIYWQALSGGLFGELRLALDYVESFMDDFRENARQIYGCRGIFIDSVNTPESGKAACFASHIINWTAAAAWLSEHFFDYYRWTGDEDYLREHAFPFMAEAALFYEDFLRPTDSGKYEFAPSTSPENVSATTTRMFGSTSQVSKNAAMDIGCVTGLLLNCIEAAQKTGMYLERTAKWKDMLSRLPEYKFNDDGSLKEWADDFYEDFVHHRHQSHMYGLFPGHTINEKSPEYNGFVLAENKRLYEGLDSQSSWSMIFMACVYARMKKGNTSLEVLSEMTRHCCMNNLFTLHNDWRRTGPVGCDDFRCAPFQIDANIGFTGAVNEMLVSSADGDLSLLPALPDAWKKGSIKGITASGGYSVSMHWENDSAEVMITGGFRKTKCRLNGNWHFENGDTEKTICGESSFRIFR